jgi:hypothetical protein
MIKIYKNINIMFYILFIMHCNDNLKKKLKKKTRKRLDAWVKRLDPYVWPNQKQKLGVFGLAEPCSRAYSLYIYIYIYIYI